MRLTPSSPHPLTRRTTQMAEQLLSHCLADLAYPDIQAYLQRRDLILIPMASTEQHRPPPPLSTDSVTAHEGTQRPAGQGHALYNPTGGPGHSPQPQPRPA